jgi:hypothetical protein
VISPQLAKFEKKMTVLCTVMKISSSHLTTVGCTTHDLTVVQLLTNPLVDHCNVDGEGERNYLLTGRGVL